MPAPPQAAHAATRTRCDSDSGRLSEPLSARLARLGGWPASGAAAGARRPARAAARPPPSPGGSESRPRIFAGTVSESGCPPPSPPRPAWAGPACPFPLRVAASADLKLEEIAGLASGSVRGFARPGHPGPGRSGPRPLVAGPRGGEEGLEKRPGGGAARRRGAEGRPRRHSITGGAVRQQAGRRRRGTAARWLLTSRTGPPAGAARPRTAARARTGQPAASRGSGPRLHARARIRPGAALRLVARSEAASGPFRNLVACVSQGGKRRRRRRCRLAAVRPPAGLDEFGPGTLTSSFKIGVR
jgi:hypothetical protein